jgi:N-acetyl-anhydromuramyl-L-alanine amidase AmpD
MTNADDYARAIIAEGQTARTAGEDYLQHDVITPRGIKIALATVYVESNFVMYANNSDPDSLNYPHEAISFDADSDGLFQQRQAWWGTVAERMDPALSAAMFYHHLAALNYNDPNTSPGTFAQDVQQSAFPDRYDQRFDDASALYDRLVGSVSAPAVPAPTYTETAQWSTNNQPRNGTPIDLWLLHTQEGDGTAASLADFLDNPANQVSYHYTIDNTVNVVDVVDTDLASWSVLDANDRSINLCFAGSRADWSREDWLTNMGNAIDVAAYLAVQDCRKYGIATTVVTPPYGADPPGISDHRYVTDHLGIGTHTDVGDGFPWDVFTAAIEKYTGTGDDTLMGVNIDRLNQAVDKILGVWASRSIYRADDNTVDDTVGMLLNIDATTFDLLTENQALLGDPTALARVQRLANGQGPAASDPNAVAHAKFILSKCPAARGVAVVDGTKVPA